MSGVVDAYALEAGRGAFFFHLENGGPTVGNTTSVDVFLCVVSEILFSCHHTWSASATPGWFTPFAVFRVRMMQGRADVESTVARERSSEIKEATNGDNGNAIWTDLF